jgi:hypothetical protein
MVKNMAFEWYIFGSAFGGCGYLQKVGFKSLAIF